MVMVVVLVLVVVVRDDVVVVVVVMNGVVRLERGIRLGFKFGWDCVSNGKVRG